MSWDKKGRRIFGSLPTESFLFSVNSLSKNGFRVIRKYGVNDNVDVATSPEDIWDGGGNYVYDSANTEMFVYSKSSADVGITVAIEGLVEDTEGNWNEKYLEVELNGDTPVSIGDFVRVFRARVKDVNTPVDDVLITTSASAGISPSNSELRAVITQGKNSTYMCMFTVPTGFTAFLFRLYGSVGKSKDAELGWDIRAHDEAFISTGIVGLYQESKQFEVSFERVESKADIKASATTESNNAVVRASFHMLVVDNRILEGREF